MSRKESAIRGASTVNLLAELARRGGGQQLTQNQLQQLAGIIPLPDLAASLGHRFDDQPEGYRHYLAAELVCLNGNPGNSCADVLRLIQKKGYVVNAVFGGTKLEEGIPRDERMYFHFNQEVARRLVLVRLPNGTIGISIVTGGGPGPSMAGPHITLRAARRAARRIGIPSESKCVVVQSGLGSEPAHPYADRDFTVRPQIDTLLREVMIMMLAHTATDYLGFKGTLCEMALVEFINYCAGRSPMGFPMKPHFVIDAKRPAIGRPEFLGGSFYAWWKMFEVNSAMAGLTKAGIPDWRRAHVLDTDVKSIAEAATDYVRDLVAALEELGILSFNGH